ncbi:MAG: methionine--tRNA ligase [Candidatus Micrarchaeota archaeon]|nr:methionine--tRNA ligase [Candidatus Micrarchaeota archaeon]
MVRYIVTSALPYVQGIIHLGNLIGSILPADIYYKYLKMSGEDAIFVCGSDEHGAAIELKAIKEKTTPEALAEGNHQQIKRLLEQYECTFTIYGRTHTEQNRGVVYEIFESLYKNGNITKVESELPYCSTDKRFISDRFIEGKCPVCGYAQARGDQCDSCGNLLEPKELIDPYCTICGKKEITFRKTTNLALDLVKLQPKIKEFIEASSANEWSKNAVHHSLGYIKRGLRPREITRDLKYGFPVPLDGFRDKLFYVWFDAPIAYIGITKEWDAQRANDYWKGKDTRLVQFMGKDNIEPHTLIWPGILIGSNLGYALPRTIYAYEYLNWEGEKFSKSRGVGLDIKEAIDILPADYWRFSLASMLPQSADTDFTLESLKQAIDNDMNNVIGNFINRTFTLIKSNFDGAVPKGKLIAEIGTQIEEKTAKYQVNFERIDIREALRSVVELAGVGNTLMSSTEPWKLAKSADPADYQKMADILYSCVNIVYRLGILLHPFTPSASSEILKTFRSEARMEFVERTLEGGMKLDLEKVAPLFHKLTDDEIKRIEQHSGKKGK